MLRRNPGAILTFAWMVSLASSVAAQDRGQSHNDAATHAYVTNETVQNPGAASDSLQLHFAMGSSVIVPSERPLLDQAARLYRDGHPVVLIVSGATDAVGSATSNLVLSNRRAMAVFTALVARGIPAEHFQILAMGETEPTVPQTEGLPQPANRRVEIRWR